MDHIDVLCAAFLALPQEQLANLDYHRRKGTRILCGAMWFYVIDRRGGA